MKKICLLFLAAILFMSFVKTDAQKMTKKNQSKIKIPSIKTNFSINDFDNELWEKVKDISVENYWSGEKAPIGRQFKTRLLWSETALYIRFEANQTEPLIVSATPNLSSETNELWNRDVCEIFIAPNKSEFRKYLEFEIAPTGEWVDLAIHQMPDKRETNLEYDSKMQSAAKIEKGKVWMAIKVEWKAFGKTPKTGDIWMGNIFRCIGQDPTRGYLSWQATNTKEPSFHVPTKFGEFEFVK